jgi:hypothetical protein
MTYKIGDRITRGDMGLLYVEAKKLYNKLKTREDA